MRSVALILAMVWASVSVMADAGEPYALLRTQQWQGRVVRTPNRTAAFAVIAPRPTWSSTSPGVVLLRADGTVLQRAFPGADVRAMIAWEQGYLIATVDSGAVRLRTVRDDLTPRQQSDVMIRSEQMLDAGTPIRLDKHPESSVALLSVGSTVYAVRQITADLLVTPLEQRVTAGLAMAPTGRGRIALSYSIGSSAFLSIIDDQLQAIATTSVPLSDDARILHVGNYVMMLSTVRGTQGTVVTALDLTTFATFTRTIPIEQHVIAPWIDSDGGLAVAMLTTRSGRPELVVTSGNDIPEVLPEGTFIPGEYGMPRCVHVSGDTIVVTFAGGIVTTDADGTILSRDACVLGLPLDHEELFCTRDGIILSTRSASIVMTRHEQPLWFIVRGVDTITRLVIPLLLVSLVAVFWALYRRQRRFLDAVIDIPGAGVVIVLDANGRLVRTNERAAALMKITRSVPMRRLFRSYMQQKGLDALAGFIEHALSVRTSRTDRVMIEDADEQREFVITSIPLVGLLGQAAGFIISGVDITEALERQRLVNWAQLAHDMQTNLSTIRLNAEQLDEGLDQRNTERRRRILFQVGVLIQRVRDLVSVGRSDELVRLSVHSAELCTEIRHEFDPVMFPHVTFSMKLRGTMMNVDKLKISRAVRNAVENAIKALRGQEGTVEIATWYDPVFVFIRVSDSGVGMDIETLANMMRPYFTTAKDGTGTGIGTMIMQHVMDLHNGTLRVSSQPGVGTQVIFRIPHGMDIRHRYRATEELDA